MLKRTVLGAFCVAAMLVGGMAQAQENATLVLRSGERVSGQLVDLGGVGYTVRVNGQDRQIPQNDVAVIDFTGGTMTNADWAKFTGTSQVVLKNGQTIDGQLYDIGGTTPLKLTLKTSTGDRELSSSDVARIVISKPENAVATTGSAATPSAGSSTKITVSGQQAWTSTGITVTKGQTLTFNTTGEVQLSGDTNDKASSAGSSTGRRAPRAAMPGELAGALIGKIGNGRPFGIGNQTSIVAPASGLLFLGVNDDAFGDNQGAFQVTITKQ
ncbi:MAG: hypothetical protein DMF84_22820 [Acidobacteria bacterium]|nr:MAG: hypothetical protein DMF84_22820 [Acidobacteriota bacterium]